MNTSGMTVKAKTKVKMEFKERKDIGDIGENIVFSALLENIIPNRGSVKMFLVDSKNEDSIQYNRVNGDMGFLGMNLAECRVDVKSRDWVYERCLDHIDSGVYLFLNAYPINHTTGLPLMFKLDASIKKWIKQYCEVGFDEGKRKFRILKHKLDEVIPPDYYYTFDDKKFTQFRTDTLVKIGIMKP